MLVLAFALSLFAQSIGNPILVTPPAPSPNTNSNSSNATTNTSSNVTVNVTPPPPDPKATQAMYDYTIANGEYDHVAVPVGVAVAVLGGTNIWTNTPPISFSGGGLERIAGGIRVAAMGLFLLGIVWTGAQIIIGTGLGTTSWQLVLPLVIGGFMLAAYAPTIVERSIAVNNWLCSVIGSPSLQDFSAQPLKLPERPVFDVENPIPVAFFEGLIGSLVYGIVLIILEVRLIMREAILWVTSAAMPVAGALWAFGITRGWGVTLFRLFFGWLFGQPLVVLCLALASSLLTLLNVNDGPAVFLVKIAICFVALKAVSLFASGGLGSGGGFGVMSALLLMRRHLPSRASSAPAAPSTQAAPAVQPGGPGGGTGSGTAVTNRPWRPAIGTA